MRMLGTSRFCQLALVAVVAAAMASGDAMAWSHGSWGSSGSYGSYGSSASYGSYGSSGSHGSYGGGIFSRRRAHRAARASYGSYGSYGGSYGSCGSCGSYGSYGSHGSSGNYGAPAPAPADEAPAAPEDDTASTATGSASIAVTLPSSAKVFVNGQLTTSTGSSRNYVSSGLEEGKTYAYKLRVEFEQDGQQVVEHKVLKLQVGDNLDVSFSSEDQSQLTEAKINTELKLEVPDSAQVFLLGAATKQSGTTRSYITQRLAAGESWEGYTIRVELERDGQKLVQERTLTVEGGQTYELAFDFDAEDSVKLAQLAN